jgi:major membrane immunogen (membrane-anchored lipoprotein)
MLCACLLFTGCSNRGKSAATLAAGYYKAADATTVSAMDTETYAQGYLALIKYTGAGGHMALLKVEKTSGKDAITAVTEGNAAKNGAYSINIVADGDYTVVYGDLGNTVCTKVDLTFDDGSKVSTAVGSGNGFIAVAPGGSLKIKDFTFHGKGKDETGHYQDFINAGGKVVRTQFAPVTGK